MFFVYILTTSIMLINLLIAIFRFSHSFIMITTVIVAYAIVNET